MPTRCLGLAVVGDTITIVDAELPDDSGEPVIVLADDSWKLQSGDRPQAYAVLHQRCVDYIRENKISVAVIKASAASMGGMKLSHLTSAEVRGAVISAAASVCAVKVVPKALISRTYGDRKVDEYLKDDSFWDEKTVGGKIRKSSREAAILIIAWRSTRT
jgi:hypothetical protein